MKNKPKSKYSEAKFLLKSASKLQSERLNESAKMCIRFALMFAEKLINESGTMTTRDMSEMSRECRGWLKESRGFDKAESEAMIAQLLDRLDNLEGAVNDNDLENVLQ